MAYVKDVFATQLSVNTNAHTNVLDIAGDVAIGASYAGVETAPSNGMLVEGNVGIGITSVSVPLQIKYNAGSTQIGMDRSDGSTLATMYIDSGNDFIFSNTSSGVGFWIYTNAQVGIANRFRLEGDGYLQILVDDGDAVAGRALEYFSTTTSNDRAVLTKVSGADAGQFILYSSGTATINLQASGDSYFNGGNVAIGQTSANATLHVAGSQAVKVTATSSLTYSAATDDFLIAADSSLNTVTVTLPTAGSSNTGVVYVVKDAGGAAATNSITVDVNGGGNIDGSSSVVLGAAYGVRRFYSNGTQWLTDVGTLSTAVNTFNSDSGSGVPSAGVITLAGGSNANTSGSGSTVTINLDSDVLGLTDLTVDNLELNGNTVSTTNLNGDLIFSPDGTGGVGMGGSTSADVDLVLGTATIGANSLDPAFNITGSSGSFGINIGESSLLGLSLYWTYNATEANASATLETLNNNSTAFLLRGSELYFNTNHNDVGVGTSSPTAQLYVEGASQDWNLLMSGATTSVEVGILIGASTGTSGTFTNHNFGFRANNSNVGIVVASTARWVLGNGTATANNTVEVTGAAAIGSYATVNTAPSNGMIISGNVGIATNSPGATLDVQGSRAGKVTVPGAYPYSITSTDYIVAVDTSSAREITLPAATSNSGLTYIVKDATGSAATNNITVKSSAGTIDGTAAATGVTITTNYGSYGFYSDGTNWFIF